MGRRRRWRRICLLCRHRDERTRQVLRPVIIASAVAPMQSNLMLTIKFLLLAFEIVQAAINGGKDL